MKFNFDNPVREGRELEHAFFGSVKAKYEAMKSLNKLPEEYTVNIETALKNSEALQPLKDSPLKPEKPFATDLRRAVWNKLLDVAAGKIDLNKKNWPKTTLNLLSLNSRDLKFYSTVGYPTMDRAAHTDGYIALECGDEERVVTCGVTLNEEEPKQTDVLIRAKRVLDKTKTADEKEWKDLVDSASDDVVAHLLGPKEDLHIEKELKNTSLRTNIVFADEK
jgi:hypothetical protein